MKSVLVETDILVAAIDSEDPHHEEARRIIRRLNPILSPYALIELDLLIRSKVIIVKSYQKFWHELNNLLDQYKINVIAPKPLYHAKAQELRTLYSLTYFDSLHASAAIIENMSLISYDQKAYGGIKNLNYIHPITLIK